MILQPGTWILVAAGLLLGGESDRKLTPDPQPPLKEDATVDQILRSLGDYSLQGHKPDDKVEGYSAERGAELVIRGRTTGPDGRRTKKASKYFTCTACHNLRREDADLAAPSPDARLYFAEQNGLAFLQGSTLYGVVNRTLYFGGDWKEWLGPDLGHARRDLRKAIQLCNTRFARGRGFKPWEIESILAFLWTRQLSTADLYISKEEAYLYFEGTRDPVKRREALQNLKSKYPQSLNAHFLEPPSDREAGNPLRGRNESGALIYKLACLHCHGDKTYSKVSLDTETSTFQKLHDAFPTPGDASLYHILRYGTEPTNPRKPFMPRFTAERLSRQQMEDLRAYIRQEASSPGK